ncbi:MAG: ArsR/SmtB family transcription factor [Flavobacteriales bacterium]
MAEQNGNNISADELAGFMRAISHPTRVQIILEMARHNNQISGEIVAVKNVSPATIIQHLRDLKKAGIIQGKLFGAACHYSLNEKAIEKFRQLFNAFADVVEKQSEVG